MACLKSQRHQQSEGRIYDQNVPQYTECPADFALCIKICLILKAAPLPSNQMKQVDKLSIAIEQLEDALEAYFNGRFHSATVLAGASEQLLAGYVSKHRGIPAWVQERSLVTKIANGIKGFKDVGTTPTTEKKIGDLMNHAYNNSRHAGTKDHTLLFDPRSAAYDLIDRAITNYDMLLSRSDYELPDVRLVQRFRMEGLDGVRIE